MWILLTFATNLSYNSFVFTTWLSLLKSIGTANNLAISNLSTSAFKLTKSDFAARLDVSIPAAFFKSVFFFFA